MPKQRYEISDVDWELVADLLPSFFAQLSDRGQNLAISLFCALVCSRACEEYKSIALELFKLLNFKRSERVVLFSGFLSLEENFLSFL